MSDFTVFVNFKTYPQGTGEKAVGLAKACQEVGKESRLEIIPIVQVVDLCAVKQTVSIPVWVEHIDPQPPGKFTGWINLESVIKEGGDGALISHSEHPLPPGTVKQILVRVRPARIATPARNAASLAGWQSVAGGEGTEFKTMVCCKTLGQMERLVKLKPDYIGYEIAELIGGKVAITDFDSKAIKHAVEICGEIPLVVGAGVHKAEDLAKAKELGAEGVLISSAVVLAENPKQKLVELIKGLR